MKILASHLHHFIAYARIRNIPVKDILEVMKNPPPDFHAPASTVNATDFYKVLTLISESLNDELLGLRIGNFVNLVHLGAVYQISLKATTVEEALFYCRTYLEKTFPIAQINTFNSGKSATIALSINNDQELVNRVILEKMLTLMAREIKVMTGDQRDITVYSPFCGRDYPASWKKGKHFSVVFPKIALKAAVKDNSHWGFEILIPEYLKIMESLDPGGSFNNKVKLSALSMATPCLPDLETVAGAFNITPRTLQRRLAAEGITFREINEELKRKICDLLIRHDRYSILDISTILGYSEAASFIHSFKKWYGEPPQKRKERIIYEG